MLSHSQINSLSVVAFKRSLNDFIKRVTSREGMVHTGIIQEVIYSGGVGSELTNIVIEMTDVEGSPHLSWTDSHFIIQEGDVFVVNDPVTLLPIRGRFLVIKIEDDFKVRASRGTGSFGSAATSDVIDHNLGITPVAEDIHIVFTSGAINDIGHTWIGSITSNQFAVHIKNVPGSTLNYSWKVDTH